MVSNIIEEVKKGLTGDPLKDIQYLQSRLLNIRIVLIRRKF